MDAAAATRTLVGGAIPGAVTAPGDARLHRDPVRISPSGVTIGEINITETTSARGTAIEVVDELKAVALLGG